MRYFMTMLLGLFVLTGNLTADQSRAAEPLTSDRIVTALTESGFPVSDVRTYTTDTDPNHLLGRPGQYVVKVSWRDDRFAASDATIEVFTDATGMQARADYVTRVGQSLPMVAQWVFMSEPTCSVLRLPKEATLNDAETYQAWLGEFQG